MHLVTVSDHPLSKTGVAHQMLLIIAGLLERIPDLQVTSLSLQKIDAGAASDRWMVLPLEMEGTKPEFFLPQILKQRPADALLVMSDPRFYQWMVPIEHELKRLCPNLIYYHVWDNEPAPRFNKGLYDVFDQIPCISKLTHALTAKVGISGDKLSHVPHAVEADVFAPGDKDGDKFLVLWDSLNMKRKMPQVACQAFAKLHAKHPDTHLIMKTQPASPLGTNLQIVAHDFGIPMGALTFIENNAMPYHEVAALYARSHCLLNTSFNEGFGLSVLQGLMSGCLVVCPDTGGMRDQVPPGSKFGFSVPISYRSLDGGVDCPYIYFDFASPEAYAERLERAYYCWKNKSAFETKIVAGREWALKNFSLANLLDNFDTMIHKSFREPNVALVSVSTI